ncbi:hypothetical protein AS9A_1099 [Hoyosella subflava DQS3-9A1]|uniref:Uncharacterized protein n=1 Tax=Hoyosella subflava (strain DSM 45089 / JCM 17490 / NBRC 109087 / DQS3-9A1) TaxID=443218 RepID=F6EQT9_HOYSD|nr:hypothetical protein AS9A_1099 [Hoyosella subflava DQS3-9A1]
MNFPQVVQVLLTLVAFVAGVARGWELRPPHLRKLMRKMLNCRNDEFRPSGIVILKGALTDASPLRD